MGMGMDIGIGIDSKGFRTFRIGLDMIESTRNAQIISNRIFLFFALFSDVSTYSIK